MIYHLIQNDLSKASCAMFIKSLRLGGMSLQPKLTRFRLMSIGEPIPVLHILPSHSR